MTVKYQVSTKKKKHFGNKKNFGIIGAVALPLLIKASSFLKLIQEIK